MEGTLATFTKRDRLWQQPEGAGLGWNGDGGIVRWCVGSRNRDPRACACVPGGKRPDIGDHLAPVGALRPVLVGEVEMPDPLAAQAGLEPFDQPGQVLGYV